MSDREKIKKYEYISLGIGLSGVLIIILATIMDQHFLFFLGFLTVIVSEIYARKKIRCPHCNEYLVTRFGIPRYCPHCGGEIQ